MHHSGVSPEPHIPMARPCTPDMTLETPSLLQLIFEDPHSYSPETLPSWILSAWVPCDQDQRIWNAAPTWYEGLTLQSRHPSFAGVAYVSAVETLSRSKVALERLNIEINKNVGSLKRVMKMLKLVLSGDDAENVGNSIYESSNKAVHAGNLQGFESSLGSRSAITILWTGEDKLEVPFVQAAVEDLIQYFLSEVVRPPGIGNP